MSIEPLARYTLATGTLLVRSGTAADAAAVLGVLHRAHGWNLTHGFNFTAAEMTAAELEPRLLPERFFVGEAGGGIVATIEVLPKPTAGDWSFHLLAVEPGAGRRGAGRAMVGFAEAWARDRGGRRLILDTPETHPTLPAYYARLGYVPFDTTQWPGKLYRSVLMAKSLG